MSILNAYWVPPAVQDFVVHEDNPRAGDLGFRNDIPVELPVTVGAQYFGEGREELPIYPKTLNSSTQAEYHAVGGAIPALLIFMRTSTSTPAPTTNDRFKPRLEFQFGRNLKVRVK